MNAFCMRLGHFVDTNLKNTCKTAFLLAIFTLEMLAKHMQKTFLKLMNSACIFRHFMETALKKRC